MSIVLGIIKGFIGSWGLNVIEFYMANSLWINGTLLLYALIISTSWRNYETIKKYFCKTIIDQHEPKVKSWSKTEIARNVNMSQISWEIARKQLKIPLIAESGKYLPVFASIDGLKKLFPKEVIINIIRDTTKKQEV